MPHNENSRVKIPALVHFTRLGYKYISLRKYEGVIDDDTNILVDVFCDAINRINATSLTTTDVQKIVNALKAMLENDDLGREFYSVLINGYNGLKLIDFEDFGGTVNSQRQVPFRSEASRACAGKAVPGRCRKATRPDDR